MWIACAIFIVGCNHDLESLDGSRKRGTGVKLSSLLQVGEKSDVGSGGGRPVVRFRTKLLEVSARSWASCLAR